MDIDSKNLVQINNVKSVNNESVNESESDNCHGKVVGTPARQEGLAEQSVCANVPFLSHVVTEGGEVSDGDDVTENSQGDVNGDLWSVMFEEMVLGQEPGGSLLGVNPEVSDLVEAWSGDSIDTPQWCWDKVMLAQQVMQNGYPNAWGAHIPVNTKWNLELLEQLL